MLYRDPVIHVNIRMHNWNSHIYATELHMSICLKLLHFYKLHSSFEFVLSSASLLSLLSSLGGGREGRRLLHQMKKVLHQISRVDSKQWTTPNRPSP